MQKILSVENRPKCCRLLTGPARYRGRVVRIDGKIVPVESVGVESRIGSSIPCQRRLVANRGQGRNDVKRMCRNEGEGDDDESKVRDDGDLAKLRADGGTASESDDYIAKFGIDERHGTGLGAPHRERKQEAVGWSLAIDRPEKNRTRGREG